MSLGGYVGACRQLAQELRESLSSDQLDFLGQWMHGRSEREWKDWRVKYQDLVALFVAETPSQRKRRKAWAGPEVRALLTFAAIQHLQWAEAVLDVVDRRNLAPGGSYRDMAALAGIAWLEIASHPCLTEPVLPGQRGHLRPDD